MTRESNGLFWAIAFLLLIVASIGSFYIWSMQPEQLQKPVFVNIGNVQAYAGNKRLVLASVTLEVTGRTSEAKVSERLARTRTAIISRFADFTDKQLSTTDGKEALQELIRDDLNELFGKRTIREVLFTSFVMSVS